MRQLLLVCSAMVLIYGSVFAMERDSSKDCNCKSTLQDLQEQISMEKSRRTQAIQAIKMQFNEEKYKREQLEKKIDELQEQIDKINQEKTEEF